MNNVKVSAVDCHVVYWEAEIPQFLTIKRSPQERYPLIWQCVTGGINTNERTYQTAIRELKEETNLDAVVNCQLRHTCHYNTIHGDILLLAFLMDINDYSKMEAGDDADDTKLFSLDDLPLLAFESHEKIVQLYFEYIKKMENH